MNQFFQVDAFTKKPFHGNTAGVCMADQDLPEKTLRSIAMQNNLPATAFIQQRADGFSIRWFSPTAELPLCGHASLASAHILFSEGLVPPDQRNVFHTKNGPLFACLINDSVQLDFPAYAHQPAAMPPVLEPLFIGKARAVSQTMDRYIIEVEKEEDVRNFRPDFHALKNVKCILTSKADPHTGYDFVSRYFAVPDGVNEDSVTGSSHCSLAPYWAKRLNKTAFHAMQVSARGGELSVSLRGDRVLIEGHAVTVIKGRFLI